MYRLMRTVLVVTVLLSVYDAVLGIYVFPQIVFIVAFGLAWRRWRKRRQSSDHGTARWATLEDIPHLLEGNGLIIGQMYGRSSRWNGIKSLFNLRLSAASASRKCLTALRRKQPPQMVRLTDSVHTAVFAPTGTGKGVSCVIPFALTCTDPMVIVDFKGEIYSLTKEARRKMGHRIVVIDPYKIVTQLPDTFNPLNFIDRASRTALDDCRDLAEMLVIRSPDEKEPHWADSAEVWIAAMTAMVATFAEGDDKSLQSVRRLLTNPDRMQAAITLMGESDEMEGMLSRLGHQLGHFKDKELSSTLTTTNRYMRFLDTTAIAESTSRSSFNPGDLLTKKMTVYLILPPDRMRAQMGLLRLWVGSMLRAVVKGGVQNTKKVQFVLDEAASFSHMEIIDDAVDKFRGYGVRLLLIYQSLGQLRRSFPDGQDQTLLSNVSQVFFATNDNDTAEYISARLGETTITSASGGTGTSRSISHQSTGQGDNCSYSSSSNQNWQLMGRKLLRPEEITALPSRMAITFVPGIPPIATTLIRYYEKKFKAQLKFGLIKATFTTVFLLLTATFFAGALIATIAGHAAQQPVQTLPPICREIPYSVKSLPAKGH